MPRITRRSMPLTAAVTSAVLVAASLIAVDTTALAAPVGKRPKVQVEPALPYAVLHPASQSAPAAGPASPRAHTNWPAAGAAVVSAPALQAQVRDRASAQQAGVNGVLFTVARQQPGSGSSRIGVNYSSFANAGGAGFGNRLKLVALPACALTTPAAPACQVQTPLASTNDPVSQTVSASLPETAPAGTARTAPTLAGAAGSQAVLAAVAGPSGSNDDFTATSLAPSGSWSLSGASGSFNWSYPISVPPVAAGTDVAPSVALSYDSAIVDGRVAATNNQDSWLGQGWEYSPGFIERTYRQCADDSTLAKADQTLDECWAGPLFTYNLGGSSNVIVRDDSTGDYHLKVDDGSRVELIGAGSGAYANEYWKVTAASGVQYYFGRDSLPGGSTTNATWTVPVCGDSNTACTGDGNGVISPIETQAWRWNLDYVVDPHHNATAYYYTAEQNYYGQDGKTTPKPYTRGGYLNRIDYGLRESAGSLSSPTDQITFTVAERCTSTCTTFDAAHAANWPDSPQDQDCAWTGTCNNHAPTFWSRKRLTAITTYFDNGASFAKVDNYALGQSFPTSGDPELELDSITRTGYSPSGTALALPKVGFTYQLLDNRVAGYKSQPAMQMWRLNQVATETGEKILVFYDQAGRSPAQCTSTTVPSDPAQDTKECYPVYWTPVGYTSPILDYFHKHLVTEVDVDDANATGTDRYTNYSYLGTPAWHFDDNEVVKPKNRTYGQFRGFQTVQTRVGNPNHASNGVADAWTLSTTTYYRGMNGDQLPGGAARTATVTDSLGATVADTDQYADTAREVQTFNGANGSEVSATVTTPATVATTATRNRAGMPDLVARMVRTGSSRNYTDLAGGSSQQATTSYSYDSIGRPTQQVDSGTGVGARCTSTQYADNTTSWIRNLISETVIAAPSCVGSGGSGVLKDVRNVYDGGAAGSVPGPGDATEVDTETSASPEHWAVNKADYDDMGRVISTTVVATPTDSRVTHTSYTPAEGGPLTSTLVKNALSQQESTTVDPGRGSVLETVDLASHKIDASYDPVGRLTSVWRPGQKQGTDPATTTYSYLYGPSAPLAVTTKTLVDPGNGVAPGYVTHISIYDAFGQLRQTQDAAEGGGRNVSDTYTDSHGWVVATNTHWHTTGTPTTLPIGTAQSGIEDRVQTIYDGVGRPTLATEYNGVTAKWSTKTVYGGDQITTVPPKGGPESTSRTDVRGNLIELDQWVSAPVINADSTLTGGSARKTSYGYDELGRRTDVTTAAQDSALDATWTTHYDLAGRIVEQDDPDSGATIDKFDDANELVSSMDADGSTLYFGYDKLGRKLGEYNNTPSAATMIASWQYDTVQVGQLSSATSYTADGNYTNKITGYDGAGNPLGSELDLPSGDVSAGFAPSYTSQTSWTSTHLTASTTPASAGLLPSETIVNTYDGMGNATGTSGYTDYVSAASYSPYGEPNQYTLGVNNQTAWLTFTRDAQTRRVSALNLSAQIATPQLENVAYSYDPSGNITRAVDTEGGGTGAPVETNCYDYSATQELTTAWSATDGCAADVAATKSSSTVGGPQPYWLTWTIDAAGGQLSKVAHDLSATPTRDVTTNYLNGVAASSSQSAHAHALNTSTTMTGTTQTGSGSYTYDADGNTLNRTVDGQAQTFSYLSDKRIGGITTPAGTVSYDYDADGNQLLRRDPTTITLFLTGEEFILTKATKAIAGIRYYTHNGTVVAVRVDHGNPAYEFTDLRGTALTVVPTTQTGVSTPIRRHFDPYGAALPGGGAPPPTWPDQHAFLNKPVDKTTGLDELGARLYDPATNRFLAVDPVFDPKNPQQDNGYAYADNNPVGLSDPTGLDPDPNVNHSSLHEAAVQTDADAIRAYVQSIGGNTDDVTTDRTSNSVNTGAKSGNGGAGYPDIQYYDRTRDCYYVWEVKGTRTSSVSAVVKQGKQAASEVQGYIGKLQAQHPRSHVYAGFNIGVPLPFTFGAQAFVSFDFLPNSGALVYAKDPDPGSRDPAPKPKEVPVQVPADHPVPVMPTPMTPTQLPPQRLPGPAQPQPTGPYPTPGPQAPNGYSPSPGGGGWHIEVPQFQLSPQYQQAVEESTALLLVLLILVAVFG